MAKPKRRYVCQACGSVQSRWQGQCPDCSEWNTLVEDAGAVVTAFSARHNLRSGGRAFELVGLDADIQLPPRTSTGIAEFDRALGGGLVAGSATLIGGDPGIGKSTLLLQSAADQGRRSGHQATAQGAIELGYAGARARRQLDIGIQPDQFESPTARAEIVPRRESGDDRPRILDQGIPFRAIGALSLPAALHRAAGLADISSFRLRHGG